MADHLLLVTTDNGKAIKKIIIQHCNGSPYDFVFIIVKRVDLYIP